MTDHSEHRSAPAPAATALESFVAAGDQRSRLTDQEPWPGLRAFTADDALYFAGRDEETSEVSWLAQRGAAVLLYGRSGLGKTSLLQAGLVPELRSMGYVPMLLRVDYSATAPDVGNQIKQAIIAAMRANSLEGPEPTSEETLWEFLHRREVRIRSAGGPGGGVEDVTFVLIVDQFEEAFTLGAQTGSAVKVDELFAELDGLVEHRLPPATRARLEARGQERGRFDLQRQMMKLVVALREDYLPQLDACNQRLPVLSQNRFRLQPLSRKGAEEVVNLGRDELFEPGAKAAIVDFVSNQRGEVEPAHLSHLCSELNRIRLKETAEWRRTGASDGTENPPVIRAPSLQETGPRIIDAFYESEFGQIPPPVRAWLEERLLSDSGYRQQADEQDLLTSRAVRVPVDERRAAVNRLIKNTLLRREPRDGRSWLELTHDLLISPARRSRDARSGQRETDRARAQMAELREAFVNGSAELSRLQREVLEQLEAPIDAVSAQAAASLRAELGALAAEAALDQRNLTQVASLLEAAKRCALDARPGELPRAVSVALKYVEGALALEVGTLGEAESSLNAVLAAAEPKPGEQPDSEVERLAVLSELKLAEVERERCLNAEERRRATRALERVQASRALLQGFADELHARALEAVARSLPDGDELESLRLLFEAQTLSDKAATAAPGNERWSRICLTIALTRAVDAVYANEPDLAANVVAYARRKTGAFGARSHPWLALESIRLDCYEAILHYQQPQWSGAMETLDKAPPTLEVIRSELSDWHRAAAVKVILCRTRANALTRRAEMRREAGKDDLLASIDMLEEGRTTAREYAKRDPARLRRVYEDLMMAAQQASIRWQTEGPERARMALRQTLEALKQFPDGQLASPDVAQLTSYCESCLGAVEHDLGNFEQALTAYERSADALARVIAASRVPISKLNVLAENREWCASVASKLHDLERADAYFVMAIEALARAASYDGDGSLDQHRALMLKKCSIERERADLWREAGDTARAVAAWCDAVDDLLTARERLVPAPTDKTAPHRRDFAKEYRAEVAELESQAEKLVAASLAQGTSGDPTLRERLEQRRNALTARGRLKLLDAPIVDGILMAPEPQNWELRPLLPGTWRTLAKSEQARELERASRAVPTLQGATVLRMRALPLVCYLDTQLFELETQVSSDVRGVVAYLRRGDEVAVLTGSSAVIHEFNDRGAPILEQAEQAAQYLQFFVNALQAGEGLFSIIHTAHDVHWLPETPAALVAKVAHSMRAFVLEPAGYSAWTAVATVQYGDALFYSSFSVDSDANIEMSDDQPFAASLPISTELVGASTRFCPPAMSLRSRRNLLRRQERWHEAAQLAEGWFDYIGGGRRDFLGAPAEKEEASALREAVQLYLLGDDATSALAFVERRLAVAPDDVQALVCRAHALAFLGRVDEAESIYAARAGQALGSGETARERVLEDWELFTSHEHAPPELERLRRALDATTSLN